MCCCSLVPRLSQAPFVGRRSAYSVTEGADPSSSLASVSDRISIPPCGPPLTSTLDHASSFPAHRLYTQANLALVPSGPWAFQPQAPIQQRNEMFALHCFLLVVGMIKVEKREHQGEDPCACAFAYSTSTLSGCAILCFFSVCS